MPVIHSTFRPLPLLQNPHLQTVLASQLNRPRRIATQRERIELQDGDFIDIDLGQQQSGEIVAMFHGLAGSVQSNYVQGAFDTLQQAGFRPVLMHWRGCSGEPNRLPRSYHSGNSDDIRWFIDYLGQRFPRAGLFALGYSLGANALLKYLGEEGGRSALTGAMAVCPPLLLSEGANRLNSGIARVYQRHLLALMRSQHEDKRRRYSHLELPAAGRELDSFWRFDDAITAPLHGYDGVHDYYRRCSARQYLPAIRTPVHILCAADDPFFTPAILPGPDELSSCTTLELSRHGGHVGFLRGRERWLDQHVADILSRQRPAHAEYPAWSTGLSSIVTPAG